jgi:transglutaminase-like putative cysteine protease
MRIRAGFDLTLRCALPAPFVGLMCVHPSLDGALGTANEVWSEPGGVLTPFCDVFGNRGLRGLAPAGEFRVRSDFTLALPDARPAPDADEPVVPVYTLPPDVLQYLYGSRYCETDELSEVAWRLFGDVTAGRDRVEAIVRYVHEELRFGYEYASSTRTAWEAHQEQRGVCRDFVHLAVTLCRAMNLPARYCSGYLPDVDGPTSDAPMDFTAWMEVYLGGRWHTFDPRHGSTRRGYVLMAVGRDAADVALYTTFGPSELSAFRVYADVLPAR